MHTISLHPTAADDDELFGTMSPTVTAIPTIETRVPSPGGGGGGAPSTPVPTEPNYNPIPTPYPTRDSWFYYPPFTGPPSTPSPSAGPTARGGPAPGAVVEGENTGGSGGSTIGKSSAPEIIGIFFGLVAFVIVVAQLVWRYMKKRERRRKKLGAAGDVASDLGSRPHVVGEEG